MNTACNFPGCTEVRGHDLLSREGWQRLPRALLNRGPFESEHRCPVDYTLNLIRTLSSHQVSRGITSHLESSPFWCSQAAPHEVSCTGDLQAPEYIAAGWQARRKEESQLLVAHAMFRGHTSPGEGEQGEGGGGHSSLAGLHGCWYKSEHFGEA